jgi:hypothetical protein
MLPAIWSTTLTGKTAHAVRAYQSRSHVLWSGRDLGHGHAEARAFEEIRGRVGLAGKGEVGEEFADDGGEFVAVTAATAGVDDVGVGGVMVDEEVFVGCGCVETGVMVDQVAVEGSSTVSGSQWSRLW